MNVVTLHKYKTNPVVLIQKFICGLQHLPAVAKWEIERNTGVQIMDAGYANDIALLANAPAQAETLLHSLERAAVGIGLHINAQKTEYMSFNQRGDIFPLNGSSLKQVDKFTHLGSKKCS